MKSDNAKTNFLFQMLYQIVSLVIPLIIAPYLTRTLGDSSLGIYTYTYSIMFCFMTIARLGIDKHGQRVIASVRDNKEKLRVTFWSLYTVHLFFTIISLILYFLFITFCAQKYQSVYLVQGLALLGVIFDITWFFYGIENFKFVVLENLCVKISELLLIFAFVKKKEDLGIYTLIMSSSICLGYLVILPYVIKNVKPIKYTWEDVKQHIAPLCVLFIAVVATTVYQMIDKALLGLLATEESVAYYEYANKIVNVPVNLVYVMGTVLMPRACAYAAKGDKENQLKYLDYSLHFVGFLGFGAAFVFLSVSDLFSVIYYGQEFAACGGVMMALAPIIFLLGVENVIRTQYMIPNHLDKQFTGCILLTALVNLVISALSIPIIGVYGAVVGTIIAEFVCSIIQILICKSFISLKRIVIITAPYMISGLLMFGTIYVIKLKYNSTILHLLLQLVLGGLCYCAFSVIYTLFFSNIKPTVKSELKKFYCRIKKN